jgi:outer membrane lipoprotein carrier protein
MKREILIAVIGCLLMWPLGVTGESLPPDEIMDRVEARYDVEGISARFFQTSTYKALDITDSAEGRIYIKKPGRMRWEYETPEKKNFITDGESLWVYLPEENQVMMGSAATIFGDGKGGAFLSDMTLIRKFFTVELASDDPEGYWILELTPVEPSGDIQTVTLTVLKESFNILQVATENAYGDVTCHTFDAPEFDRKLDDAMFSFTIPDGTEVLLMEE